MAKVTYKSKKTGKVITQKSLDNYGPVKKASKPVIKKEGKIYKIAKNTYKEGV
jgi:hypothetical protein|tara:strand:+ start:503 stop:661 length:159 start_codon:yes stop_codon:yes gene_type:complete